MCKRSRAPAACGSGRAISVTVAPRAVDWNPACGSGGGEGRVRAWGGEGRGRTGAGVTGDGGGRGPEQATSSSLLPHPLLLSAAQQPPHEQRATAASQAAPKGAAAPRSLSPASSAPRPLEQLGRPRAAGSSGEGAAGTPRWGGGGLDGSTSGAASSTDPWRWGWRGLAGRRAEVRRARKPGWPHGSRDGRWPRRHARRRRRRRLGRGRGEGDDAGARRGDGWRKKRCNEERERGCIPENEHPRGCHYILQRTLQRLLEQAQCHFLPRFADGVVFQPLLETVSPTRKRGPLRCVGG